MRRKSLLYVGLISLLIPGIFNSCKKDLKPVSVSEAVPLNDGSLRQAYEASGLQEKMKMALNDTLLVHFMRIGAK